MNFKSQTQGTVAPGAAFAELATVVHEGREFIAGGAFVTDDRLIAYLNGPEGNWIVQTWNGVRIGTACATTSWPMPRSWVGSRMYQVSIRLDDGRRYQGRSFGSNMSVRAKRIAADRRVK